MTEAQTEQPVVEYPGISSLIHKRLPRIAFTASKTKTYIDVLVAPTDLLELVSGMKGNTDLDFDFFNNLTAIDMQEEGLAAKYFFASYRHNHSVQVTVMTPPGNPHIPSLVALYPTADWHEREAAEMVGLVFDGHPNPKNLLLDEDVHIHPLLKAHPLAKAEILQGIEEPIPGFKF